MQTQSSILQSIQDAIARRSVVTIALSGGIDSVVMLHACVALSKHTSARLTVNAVHIHHGLSPNADAWLVFCEQLCQGLDVPLKHQKVSLKPQPRSSLEALAREERYAAIENLALPNSLILLGQHQDDQAETFLLQLKRGAGPKGLSAMAASFTKQGNIEYARPWVNAGIGRSDIEAYAAQHQLSWVEDESNQNINFERNFLRKEVMPLLVAKWPKISNTIARSAALCATQNQLVEAYAQETLGKVQQSDGSISLAGLLVLPADLANEVLRLWTHERINSSVSCAQLNEIVKLSRARIDQVGYVQVSHWQCRSFQQHLYWLNMSQVVETPEPDFTVAVQIDAREALANITFGQLNRKVQLVDNRPPKTIKTWLKENNVKPWRRLAMAVVSVDKRIIALQIGTQLTFTQAFACSVTDVNTVNDTLLLALTHENERQVNAARAH